jgi:hypothetical protein
MRAGMSISYFTVLFLLPGCAGPTEAQRIAKTAGAGVNNAVEEFRDCRLNIWQKPEYSHVVWHLPSDETNQFTTELPADKLVPTPEEAKSLAALYDDMNVCRSKLRSAVSTYRSDLVPLFSESETLTTNITLKLVQRKMTWEQAAQALQAAEAEFQQKLSSANEQYLTELRTGNQEELAQRRSRIEQQAAKQQQVYNQQLLLNSLNRPVNTSCLAAGSMINCTSQ